MNEPTSIIQRRPRTGHKRVGRVALISVHGDPLLPIGCEEAGGQNVYVREVARALAARGVAVDVFTRGRDCERPEVTMLGGARVIRLPAGPRGFISRNALFPHLPELLQHLQDFAAHQDLHYDVVHTNYWLSGWVGLALGRTWGLPHVHTHHSLGAVKFATTGQEPPFGRARLEIENMLLDRCDRIVATSPEDVASMGRYYPAAPQTTIVPCGVDPAVLGPRGRQESRQQLGLPADRAILCYVGRFDPAKGVETFVRAAARDAERHDVHLVFAGGWDAAASDQAEYQRILDLTVALGLGDRTTFLGKVAHDRLAAVYAAADICVVPSHYEAFGLVAIEAMRCGTPVVASDVGGLRYTVVHRETGLLAPVQDEGAFAAALDLLLTDPRLRKRMGEAGTRLVGRVFTWPSVADRLESLYQGVMVGEGSERTW